MPLRKPNRLWKQTDFTMAAPALLSAADAIREAAVPFAGTAGNYDPLFEWMGDASIVLLGESTHGTHEFYRARVEITKRLIKERQFTAVAIESDWPDAARVNRFVKGAGDDAEAVDALADFRRFPSWLWRNADALDFAGWLRTHNERQPEEARAGFYGLDLYILHASIRAVLRYLDERDAAAAERARRRYACFESFGSVKEYALSAGLGIAQTCEDEVVSELMELLRNGFERFKTDGGKSADEHFFAVQNARVVQNAERYYRHMFGGQTASWNLRDRHMAETLDALIDHLHQRQKRRPKIVVWAHNSHLGDARATEMGVRGMENVGQFVRERHAGEAALVGFTTFSGTVTAAAGWGEPARRFQLRPALPGSVESLFHETATPQFMLNLHGDDEECGELLSEERLERAVGVVYQPESERDSHYFQARLAEQFDVVIHFDESRAVEPLERDLRWQRGEPPELFPTGM